MPPNEFPPPAEARCPNCGAPLSPEAPQGLCPKCLFAGLAEATEDGAKVRAQLPAPSPAELSSHFPQLEILECLGRGGMGVVYRARQKSLDRIVALKLLAPERVGDPAFAERFSQEALALAKLSHPNIVTVHDFGQAGGFFFLLMEFVDGVNLRQAMKAGRFTPEQALAIVPPVCEALQYAHERGIVHRDIKPENLLLDKDGRVKIADFGIAKMLGESSHVGLAESQPAGTPQYMAPEQKDHRGTDHRADIYSLGVVLYELLTGELPGAKLQPPSQRVQVDVRIDEIVLRALQRMPELRFATAREFRTQVETISKTTAADSTLPSDENEAARLNRNGRVAIGLGVVFVVLSLISLFVSDRAAGGPESVIAFGLVMIAAFAFRRKIFPRHRTRGSIAFAALLCILAFVVPLVAGRMHGAELRAAEAERVAKVRQLQAKIMALSERIGDANASAGRAASRAGNSAERDETRAQAREERLDHERRSAKLRAELAEIQISLATETAKSPEVKGWRATLILLTSLALAMIGVPLLLNQLGSRVSKTEANQVGPPPMPETAERLVGVQFVAVALTIVWWFTAFPLITYCADAIRRPDSLFIAIVVMGILFPVFGALARIKANQWMANDRGRVWLRGFSILGGLFSLPAIGFTAFFFKSSLSESGGWHPNSSEAIVVPLICFAAVLLPFAAVLLWQAQRVGSRPRAKIFAVVISTVVGLAAFGWGVMANQRTQFSGGKIDVRLEPVRVVGNGVIVRLITGEKCPVFELRPSLDGAEIREGMGMPNEVIAAMHAEKQPGLFAEPRSRSVSMTYVNLGSRYTVPIAFLLPTPELAQKAFDNLRSLPPVEVTLDRPQRAVVFEVGDASAGRFVAALRFSTLVEKGHPRWAELRNHPPLETPGTMERSWEILTSRPASVVLKIRDPQGSSEATALTEPADASRLHRQTARVLLYKVNETRVGLRTTLARQSTSAEFDGDFAALAAEMNRMYWTEKLKTERDWDIELCRLAGNPVLVRVSGQLASGASFSRHEVRTEPENKSAAKPSVESPPAGTEVSLEMPALKWQSLFTNEGRHALNAEHHLIILPLDPKTGNPPQRGYEIGFKSFPSRVYSQLARGDEPFVAYWDEATKRLWLGSPSALIWHRLAFEGDDAGQRFQDVKEIPPDIADELPQKFREVVAKWYPNASAESDPKQ